MKDNELDYFRPKARHIFTIWRDLIKDDFSALVELVKNSYDADASEVKVEFIEYIKSNEIEIKISDDWHGMSEEDIRTKWLIPSTDNKVWYKKSPKWRIFQWQKWIWRYAASVLGHDLEIKTTKDWLETTININWDNFSNSKKFLDEIHLDIKTKKTNKSNWTTISIFWDDEKLKIWKNTRKQEKLEIEFEKLKPPFEIKDIFEIKLVIFSEKKEINNNELLDFYDYKIEWEIDKNWFANITYYNADNKIIEKIDKQLKNISKDNDLNWEFKFPWCIKFKFLTVDLDSPKVREKSSKSFGRNLDRKPPIEYFKKYAWVSIYRWDFRIRPYWESHEDWLYLNSRRVNNPTLRLSANQLLWYITIWSENDSNLVEASSRERLKENEYFYWLVYELRQVLNELETRRYKYRWDIWLRDKKKEELDIESKINKLQEDIKNIKNDEDKDKAIKETIKLWEDFVKEKERLNKTITQYEWQVTLWKMLNITFHEISKPVRSMKENNIYLDEYIKEISSKTLVWLWEFWDKLISLLWWYKINATIVNDFLRRLKPLTIWRWNKKDFSMLKVINLSLDMFKSKITEENIEIDLNDFKDFNFYWYEKDFITVFSNFIDNSIYWLDEWDINNKKIKIESNINWQLLFKDNWLGLIWLVTEDEKNQIFEPWFSRKDSWSWLGLSISWEILERNNIGVKILESDWIYNFILELTY